MSPKVLSFSEKLMRENPIAHRYIATATQAVKHKVPDNLKDAVTNPELESWFRKEAGKRLALIKPGMSEKEIKDIIETANRFPNGSMTPISLEQMKNMREFCPSVEALLERAKHGVELMKTNPNHEYLGTVGRAVPAGGGSTRGASWAVDNPELARKYGISENTSRYLYKAGRRTLITNTLELSINIARAVGKVFPNIIMSNSETVKAMMETVKAEWGNMTTEEALNTVFFNQIVMPRMWVKDQQMILDKLFPAGHGDFPYLVSKYQMAKTLKECGIKYLLYSNADEWLWQADPIVISIAQQLFDEGHHMLIVGVENFDKIPGGGFMRLTNGRQTLVETPRLPSQIIKEHNVPEAVNTTFYVIDVDYLAEHESELMNVDKSIVVKTIPGRSGEGSKEQIVGVDSWAGDVFADVLNPAFIKWPNMNFLGIKHMGHIIDSVPEAFLGGRTRLHYVHESLAIYSTLIKRLIKGDREVAEYLFNTNYSYVNPVMSSGSQNDSARKDRNK